MMKHKKIMTMLCMLCIATHNGNGNSGKTAGDEMKTNVAYGVFDVSDFIKSAQLLSKGGPSSSALASLKNTMSKNMLGGVIVGGLIAMEEIMDHKNLRKACSGLLALDKIQQGKKGEFRSRGVTATLSGGKSNQVLTCAHRDDKTQRHVINMMDAKGIDTFNLGGYVFGELCTYAKQLKEHNKKCDPSTEFCFTPEHVGRCTANPMSHKNETASDLLKKGKNTLGKTGERSIMGASTVAFTNPVTLALAAAGAVFGLTARGIMQKKCKQQCTGYFLDQAKKLGIKGAMDYRTDVRFALAGALRNRQCFCEYAGPIQNMPTHHMFNQRTERKQGNYMKTYKKQKKQSKKCDKTKNICLFY